METLFSLLKLSFCHLQLSLIPDFVFLCCWTHNTGVVTDISAFVVGQLQLYKIVIWSQVILVIFGLTGCSYIINKVCQRFYMEVLKHFNPWGLSKLILLFLIVRRLLFSRICSIVGMVNCFKGFNCILWLFLQQDMLFKNCYNDQKDESLIYVYIYHIAIFM